MASQPGSTRPMVRSPTQLARPVLLFNGVTRSRPASAAASIRSPASFNPAPSRMAAAKASEAGWSASTRVFSPGFALPRSMIPWSAADSMATSTFGVSSDIPRASLPARIKAVASSVPMVDEAALLTAIPAPESHLPRSSPGYRFNKFFQCAGNFRGGYSEVAISHSLIEFG